MSTFQQRTVRVQRAVVRGQAEGQYRDLPRCAMSSFSDRAWAALEAQWAHTQVAGKEIFGNPTTGAAWADIQSQWRIWQRCLKRLGLRYCEPYQSRHTFATLALMAGATPSYHRAPARTHQREHALSRLFEVDRWHG